MKTAGLMFFLLAAAVSAQTNQTTACCRHPVRVFGDNTTVNLVPLFHWWTHHAAAAPRGDSRPDPSRPLAAWHRILGTRTADLEYSWYVNAVIYTSPTEHTNAVIILKNPPAAEAQLYATLKTGLAAANQQLTNDERTYQAKLKAAQKAEARAQTKTNTRKGRARTNAGNAAQLAAQDNAAATAALKDQKQEEQTRTQTDQQLSAIPSVNGQYQIDWFAMAIGRNKQGVLIYDAGVVAGRTP